MKTGIGCSIAFVLVAIFSFSCSENPSMMKADNDIGGARAEFEVDDRFQPISEDQRESLELKKRRWKPSSYCVEAQRAKETIDDHEMLEKTIRDLRRKHGLTPPPVTVANGLPPFHRGKNNEGRSRRKPQQHNDEGKTGRNPHQHSDRSGHPSRGLAKQTSNAADLGTAYSFEGSEPPALNYDLTFKPRRVHYSRWYWGAGTSHEIEFWADAFWATDAVLVVFQCTNSSYMSSYTINKLEVVEWDDDGGYYMNPRIDFDCEESGYYWVLLFARSPWNQGDGTLVVDDYSVSASAKGHAYWGHGNKSDIIRTDKFYQIPANPAGGDPMIWVFDLSNMRGYQNDDNYDDLQSKFYYHPELPDYVVYPYSPDIPLDGTYSYLQSDGYWYRSKIRTPGYSNPGFEKATMVLLTGYRDSNVDQRFVGFSSNEFRSVLYIYPDDTYMPYDRRCTRCHDGKDDMVEMLYYD